MLYQGKAPQSGNTLELHYRDNDGPIFVYLPLQGLEQMCGKALASDEIEIILLAREKELYPLIDRAVARSGAFGIAVKQNGAQLRKLHITPQDVEESGIKLSTDVLAMKGSFQPRR
jgi:hypothetical protein